MDIERGGRTVSATCTYVAVAEQLRAGFVRKRKLILIAGFLAA